MENADQETLKSCVPIGLSNSSVYPESTARTFELAHDLGFDGVEVMIGMDPASTDVNQLAKLRDYHQVPVLSVHAPCLVVTQRVWGTDPWHKLRLSAEAARHLGAQVVVVHPPFRWQGSYAARFVSSLPQLEAEFGVKMAVENMYPWKVPGGERLGYLPHWDPTGQDFDHLTLDLSHASIAGAQSLDYLKAWGERLSHVHLTDGRGATSDEHLFPGTGDQRAWEVVQELGRRDFDGVIVLELNTRKFNQRSSRAKALGEVLEQTRQEFQKGRRWASSAS